MLWRHARCGGTWGGQTRWLHSCEAEHRGAAAAPGEAELRHLWRLCDVIITSQFLIFRETIPNLRSHPHLSFSLRWVSVAVGGLLSAVAPLAVAPGPLSGACASVVVAHGLSSAACGIFPDHVPCIGRRILYHWTTREAPSVPFLTKPFSGQANTHTEWDSFPKTFAVQCEKFPWKISTKMLLSVSQQSDLELLPHVLQFSLPYSWVFGSTVMKIALHIGSCVCSQCLASIYGSVAEWGAACPEA